jgi:hypothetical protein
MIDRGHGMNSLLAQYGLPIKVSVMAHPVVKGYDGIYKGLADVRLKQLVDWENTMLKTIPPEYGIQYQVPGGGTSGATTQATTQP